MIKFFRKIRYELIGKNKTGKYLKYAIGEIMLVVIGILIALSINNWKNENATRKLELSTLRELSRALSQDTIVINSYLSNLQVKRDNTKNLLEHIAIKKPYHSNLDKQFMSAYTLFGSKSFNISAFDLMKDRGMDIISNDSLRRQISSHYTIELRELINWFGRLENVSILQAPNVYPIFTINIPNDDPVAAGWHPNNYDDLIKNPELIAPFKHFELVILSYIDRLEGFKQKTTELLMYVESEIKSRITKG